MEYDPQTGKIRIIRLVGPSACGIYGDEKICDLRFSHPLSTFGKRSRRRPNEHGALPESGTQYGFVGYRQIRRWFGPEALRIFRDNGAFIQTFWAKPIKVTKRQVIFDSTTKTGVRRIEIRP